MRELLRKIYDEAVVHASGIIEIPLEVFEEVATALKTVDFRDLKTGAEFLYNGTRYLKINDTHAFHYAGWQPISFNPRTEVSLDR